MAAELAVSLYGTQLGELVDAGRGHAILRWSDDAEHRWALNSSVLSRNLRVGFTNAEQTESFFGALLPEGVHLDRLAAQVKTSSSDLLGLLSEVGADLAGALTIGSRVAPTAPQSLNGDQIAALLSSASGFLVGGGGSALPGFQRKLTLTREAGRWVRGNGMLPSTHILKPVSPENRAAVESEHFTLEVAKRLGLSPFETWIEEIGDRYVLVIERYDRRMTSSGVERIHQEDAGQALGLPWGGSDKFEINNPGATLRAVAGLLDQGETVFGPRGTDKRQLLRYTVLNVAAGNTDAHAKNFSLLHDAEGGTRLAPYYDAAPLALSYDGSTVLAMRINAVSQQADVTRDDLIAEAVTWGLAEADSRSVIDETLDGIIEATRQVDAHPSIDAHVPGYLREQAKNLAAGRPARISSVIPLMAMPRLGSQPLVEMPEEQLLPHLDSNQEPIG